MASLATNGHGPTRRPRRPSARFVVGPALALASVALALACKSNDINATTNNDNNHGGDDSGNGGADACTAAPVHTGSLTLLHRGVCAPQGLADASGPVACTVFILPANVTGNVTSCDSSRGLAPVCDTDATKVRASAQLPDAEAPPLVCQLAQLPVSDWEGGTCAASAEAGWCYVSGAVADGGCTRAIDFSSAAVPRNGDEVLLGCE